MTNEHKILAVLFTVVAVIACSWIIRPAWRAGLKQYLDSKPWIRNGERTEVYPDGTLRFRQIRRDGKSNGPFTRWYPNGQKQLEINFADGIREGNTDGWHENGKKAFEGHFSAGKYEGKWRFFDTNGIQVAEATCRNGIFWEGTDARYVRGSLQICTYENGQIVSSEKINPETSPIPAALPQ